MPLLEGIDVSVSYPAPGGGGTRWNAVNGVCLCVDPGERVGVVGESGSGKTTLAKALLALEPLAAGKLLFNGCDVSTMGKDEFARFRRGVQMIFQDPLGSLNPRMSVGAAILEVLAVHRIAPSASRKQRVADLLARVGLEADYAGRYPHEFSGGQRQRIGIARALAMAPSVLVADEPVSALDVSVQAQILNLLMDLSQEQSMAIVLIAHDLAVVNAVCDRVVVMYLGRIVEQGATSDVFFEPAHPYTVALRAAVPDPDDRPSDDHRRVVVRGETPSAFRKPSGCVFHPRCPKAQTVCREKEPVLTLLSEKRHVACHFPCAAS